MSSGCKLAQSSLLPTLGRSSALLGCYGLKPCSVAICLQVVKLAFEAGRQTLAFALVFVKLAFGQAVKMVSVAAQVGKFGPVL